MMETSGCPEPLEKIFQKVEEESARRAQEEAKERAREEAEQRLHSTSTQNGVAPDNAEAYSKDCDAAQEADVDVQFANGADGDTKVAPIEDDDEPTALAGTLPRAKSRRRRGSVSISRIGILPIEDLISSKTQLSPSSPSHLTMAVRSPFYQAQMMNSSTTSIASGASAHSQSDAHTEDDNHVTQMHHIIPKPSIGSKIIDMPRRLSRAHSASVIPTTSSLGLGGAGGEGAPLVIGVVVQEQRVESVCDEEEREVGVSVSRRASVSAGAGPPVNGGVGVGQQGMQGALRKMSSRGTLSGLGLGMGGSKKSLPSVGEDGEGGMKGGSVRRKGSVRGTGTGNGTGNGSAGGVSVEGAAAGWLKKARELTMKIKRKASVMRPVRGAHAVRVEPRTSGGA